MGEPAAAAAPDFALRLAGDSAISVQFEARIDPAVNARVVSLAAAVRSAGLAGVLDVVAAYRSVMVAFDPAVADAASLGAAVGRLVPPVFVEGPSGPLHEIPVVYGGEAGPDLDELVRWSGLRAADVIERHSGIVYRVYMLGFAPGFCYMGTVDSAIAMPRRTEPRLRVPAGSVGIAGPQTGIYPMDSPGGWQIVGRTPVRPFDPAAADPFLLRPGDRVRFVPEI